MATRNYSVKKVADIFGGPDLVSKINTLEKQGKIPRSHKFRSGAVFNKGWSAGELPEIGEYAGFFKKFSKSAAVSVFTTKGGVLKSTMALNLARIASLHNLKTIVVGLDIQGDITSGLGHNADFDDGDFDELIAKLNSTRGLADLFSGDVRLQDIIVPLELKNLYVIPETPELVAFNESLTNVHRREYWLKEKVIDPLKKVFDLVIMDCSPNWNKLTTNALVASDALISPLECKINNFRNFKVFKHFLEEFKNDMNLNFDSIFVPTKYNLNRRLSVDIKTWYEENVTGCLPIGIKESVISEEAVALHLSAIEHAPANRFAKEIRELFSLIHERVEGAVNRPPARRKRAQGVSKRELRF